MQYFVDFLNELKKGVVAPVYLLCGPEGYLRAQGVSRLKEYILPAGGEELNFEVLDGSAMSGREIAETAASASFVPGKRLVLIRDPQILITKTSRGSEEGEESENLHQPETDLEPGAEHSKQVKGKGKGRKDKGQDKDIAYLLNYLAAPSPATCLVLETGKNVDKRKRLYKEIAHSGRVLECATLKPNELIKWLAKQAKDAGCVIDRAAADELLSRCGRDMNVLYNEIKKITGFAGGGGVVNLAMVRQLTASKVEDNVFEVVDAMGAKDCFRALAGIRDLLLRKEPPQLIIGMAARQFRLILQVQGLTQVGRSREQIIAALKMHPFVYSKTVAQRHNFTQAQLKEALTELLQLDIAVKTGQADFYPAMETLIIKVCA